LTRLTRGLSRTLYREDSTGYKYVLLLSGLNVLYALVGMLVYPQKRRFGLLLLLSIIIFIAYTLLKTFI